MGLWDRALDAAGVSDPDLREDYTRQRKLVAGYRRSSYLAVRLLLPPPLLPHVIAATAFMHHTDTLLDSGPVAERAGVCAEWVKEVRDGLAGGESADPAVRPLLHTVAAHPGMRGRVEDFLDAAAMELEFTGFATEADYQRYVDAYALPAFMLIAGLIAGEDPAPDYREACRMYIDGSQRLDFVNDLAEDLADGRLNLVRETLDAHGVTRDGLENARDTTAIRGLLAHLLGEARECLSTSWSMVGLAPPEGRPLFRAMIEIELLTTTAATTKGPGLLRAPARPPLPATARVLLRERRGARHLR
ncbi:squalene/phytoene synthase family protein [Streptomyces rhizosphaericus]|uniref:Squalene/phytoene synthase family protein n=1 Tax=Streptomyces rhizosphaericus TaxID=114699 RepID=A0A6G4A8E5_9ACTN|nr:squalene/phytoene synthase family protein [Streptomyces rhizosphaericus]NEW69565.1 squalene/phytoene synthase family protein [Streptomyces rhizosphaericus]